MNKLLQRILQDLLDEEGNKKVVGITTYTVLGSVSLVMTLMNIITKKGSLTASTAVFSLFCLVNIIIALCGKHGVKIASYMFSAEIIALFSFFLISGNPEGFSAIWICLLPSLGLFFFGRKYGSVLCGIMLLIEIALLWVPAGSQLLQYQYTASFRMRFPVLFLSFYALALFLETLRMYTYSEMNKMRRLYREQSHKDQLTGILNRQGLYSMLEKPEYRSASSLTAVMMDIDFFKNINDTYGHAAGDDILKELSGMFRANLDSLTCRWGGEEFVAISTGNKVTPETLERFRADVENHVFKTDNAEIHLTVSLGICTEKGTDPQKTDALIEKADNALYEAKRTGRNKVIVYHNS